MSFLRKFIKKFLFTLGYEIFKRHYYDFNSDVSIRKILTFCSIDLRKAVVLDVGANIGQSVDRFREYLPTASIYSFEPNPATFEKLQMKSLMDNNLQCFNVGIGSEKAELPFFLNPDSGSNSFYKINIHGDAFALSNSKESRKNHNRTTLKQNLTYNTEVSIPVDSLDNICNSIGINKVTILKIDTQGYEYEVLEGARNILPLTLIVEAEVMFSDSYEKKSSFREIESVLSEYGFVLWEIPYIGKFATEKFNRINFIDAQFVNIPMLKKLEAEQRSN